jgi:hypothetical protein
MLYFSVSRPAGGLSGHGAILVASSALQKAPTLRCIGMMQAWQSQ